MKQYEVINVPCFQITGVDDAKSYIKSLVDSQEGGYSTAINAEKIMMYSKNLEMKKIIDNSVMPVPDGSGAVIGMKFLHGVSSLRLDLPKAVFELSDQQKYRLFILGSSPDVNKQAVEKLKTKYPDINIVGRHDGYFDDEYKIVKLINEANPHIVMVALGSPKQEKFAASVNEVLPKILFIGCGGALDILAGKIKRAPKFFQDNHLEWLYRLALEPKRIKRQRVLPVYFIRLIFEIIKRVTSR